MLARFIRSIYTHVIHNYIWIQRNNQMGVVCVRNRTLSIAMCILYVSRTFNNNVETDYTVCTGISCIN